MNSIKEYFNQSELALAAYANLTPGVDPVPALQDASVGMSPTQAASFTSIYAVLAQSMPTTNGFSATLFLNNQTGEKTLAIRGTQGPADFATDFVDVFILGGVFAQEQYASLNNFYQQLIAQGALTTFEAFSVSGHSLGGFLAQAFSVDHPTNVMQTYTYNAPGIGGGVAEVLSWLGVTNTSIAVTNILNIQASGPTVIAGLGTLLGNTQPIFTEGSPHSIVPLTDSLALYNLFAKLDPSLYVASAANLGKITGILKAASNDATKSLETTLDVLRTLFEQNYAGRNSNLTAAPTATDNRDAFYANLGTLQTWLSNSSFTAFSIESLADKDAASLFALSKDNTADGLAVRYALEKGNAFAVKGAAALYDAINSDGALTLYDPATGQGALTKQYLSDRSGYLATLLARNTADSTDGNSDIFYNDTATNTTLRNSSHATPDTYQKVIFGSDAATNPDTLTGGSKDDHLYGMGGNDTLQGNGGNDYLEGGAGNDTYAWNTGDGRDTIRDTDGLGSIRINGATLSGGNQEGDARTFIGKDTNNKSHTYFVMDGDINSTAGGTLLIDGSISIRNFKNNDLGLNLSSPASLSQSVYQITPLLNVGGVRNPFINVTTGDWWLNAGTATDPVAAIAQGDVRFNTGNLTGEGFSTGTGNDVLTGSDYNDLLMAGQGNDLLVGGAGNDILVGDRSVTHHVVNLRPYYLHETMAQHIARWYQRKPEWSFDPVSQDVTLPFYFTDIPADPNASNNDVLYGGTGNDVLLGQYGDDILFGGQGEDTLLGGDGNDILIGGAGVDTLSGGAGDDVYVFNKGDGIDRILDNAGSNVLRFGAGISASDITLRLGSLMLDLGNGDQIHIDGVDWGDIAGTSGIGSFEFEDGTVLSVSELAAAKGFDLNGTAGDDAMRGTNFTDRITAGAGNDAISGGLGGDTYFFARGDGQDVISDSGDAGSAVTDTIQFAPDILQGDVMLVRQSNGNLLIKLHHGTDQITVSGQFSNVRNRIEQVVFGDGSVMTAQDLAALPPDTYTGTAQSEDMSGTAADDTLLGGDGIDTYHLGFGMGKDTLADASAGGNVIVLDGGISFADLSALRQGCGRCAAQQRGTHRRTPCGWNDLLTKCGCASEFDAANEAHSYEAERRAA